MKKDIIDYKPADIEYVLPDEVAETFPAELDFLSLDGINNKRDAISFIGRTFNCQFPQSEVAERKLDDFEKKNIREEYCFLVEENLPQKMQELEQAIEEAKKMKRDAEEALSALRREIMAYATQVKQGNKDVELKPRETFVISLCGWYVVYTWNESKQKFVLANGYEVLDDTEIFADETRNREAMLDLFGCEFAPTPRREIETEGMPFGGGEMQE